MSDVSAIGGHRKTHSALGPCLDFPPRSSFFDPGRRGGARGSGPARRLCGDLVRSTARSPKSSQDIHFDMGEMVAWSREVTFGHAQASARCLPGWLRAWFSVFSAR